MWKPLLPAVALACLIASPLHARHGANLPENAPLPSPRPEAQEVAATRWSGEPPGEPIAISSVPQPIPQARLQVRVIGPGFSAPRGREIDFGQVAASRDRYILRVVENALSSAIRGSAPIADGSADIASAQ